MSLSRIKEAFRALRRIAVDASTKARDLASKTPLSQGNRGGSKRTDSKLDDGASDDGAPVTPIRGSARLPTNVIQPSQQDKDKEKETVALVNSLRDEIKRSKAQLNQRDNEIAVLVSMVKTAKTAAVNGGAAAMGAASAASAALPTTWSQQRPPLASSATPLDRSFSSMNISMVSDARSVVPRSQPPFQAGLGMSSMPQPTVGTTAMMVAPAMMSAEMGKAASIGVMLANGVRLTEETLRDREKSFEAFKQAYPRLAAMEDNKRELREKYDEAKMAAERVNEARAQTNRLKGEIERRRVERAMATIVSSSRDGDSSVDAAEALANAGPDKEEETLKEEMDAFKSEYKASFQKLRDLKAEIEQVQRILESNRLQLQTDFDSWYENCLARLQNKHSGSENEDSLNASMSATLSSAGGSALDASASSNSGMGATLSQPSMLSSGMPVVQPMNASGSHVTNTGNMNVSGGSAANQFFQPMATQFAPMMNTFAGYQTQPQQQLMPGQVSMPTILPQFAGAGMMPYGYGFPMPGIPMQMGNMPGMGSMGGAMSFAPQLLGGLQAQQPLMQAQMQTSHMPSFNAGPMLSAGSTLTASGAINISRPASNGTVSSQPGESVDFASARSAPMLTGNADADADIAAFYRAKEELLKRTRGGLGSAGK
jgi:hypothetical protein